MASRCDCNNPCSCFFADDGNSPVFPGDGSGGRYNSVVSGIGSASNPYKIEFIDSGEYKVPTQQVSFAGPRTAGHNSDQTVEFDTIDYYSPNKILIGFPDSFDDQLFPQYNRFWFVSANITFSAESASGVRQIYILYTPATTTPYVVAAKTSTGLGEPVTLSANGFTVQEPGVNPNFANGFFEVHFRQNSGVTLTVTNASFSIVAL